MAFGIYIHIPYCIQRCPYCDFATYEQNQIPAKDNYIQLLIKEIRQKSKGLAPKAVDTLFFGGGTPSLLEPVQILTILTELKQSGFSFKPNIEITIEINPATLTPQKIENYLSVGINRFSVGAQTFSDRLLKKIGRKHSAQDTRDTIAQLKEFNVNYSLDILFALPEQSLDDLRSDIDSYLGFNPPHISGYYLTIPESNPLSINRPIEESQMKMFDLIENSFNQNGILQYEISNFSKPGFESQHNLIYWTDQEYWGIGLSAHSYLKDTPWGRRFWNPKTYKHYEEMVSNKAELPVENSEVLQPNEALTDYCHTSLRTSAGLNFFALQNKFGNLTPPTLKRTLDSLVEKNLLLQSATGYYLSRDGRRLSNLVFEQLTFLPQDLSF